MEGNYQVQSIDQMTMSSADRIPVRNHLFLGVVLYTFIFVVAAFYANGVDGSLNCSPPPTPLNGRATTRFEGYAIQFHCNQNYVMIGAASIVCRNRKWNHPPPVCRLAAVKASTKTTSSSVSSVTPSQGPSQYSLLRSLSDRQYQHEYNLPASNSNAPKLGVESKRPLFSWDSSTAPLAANSDRSDAIMHDASANNHQSSSSARLSSRSLVSTTLSSSSSHQRPSTGDAMVTGGRSFMIPEVRSSDQGRQRDGSAKKSRKRKIKKLKTIEAPPVAIESNVVSNSYFDGNKLADDAQVVRNPETWKLKAYDTLQHIPVVTTPTAQQKTNDISKSSVIQHGATYSSSMTSSLNQRQAVPALSHRVSTVTDEILVETTRVPSDGSSTHQSEDAERRTTTHTSSPDTSGTGNAKAPPTDGLDNFQAMSYHEIDIGQLDMSCVDFNDKVSENVTAASTLTATENRVEIFLPAPRIANGSIDIYRRRHNTEEPFNAYLEVFYVCDPGHHLRHGVAHSLYCLRATWVGELPVCVAPVAGMDTVAVLKAPAGSDVIADREDDGDPEMGVARSALSAAGNASSTCAVKKGGCEQECVDSGGIAVCRCYLGYRLQEDGKTCADINECEVNNGSCQYQCWNIPGSFLCFCSDGHQLGSDRRSCLDKNECLLNNGHGPCQDVCENSEGGYLCSCAMQGTQLSADNHTCEDIDECAEDNFGCSHSCLNTIGSAFCTCEDGYMLGEDWKTCEDINECEFPELAQSCNGNCINTLGSYKCSGGPPQKVIPADPEPAEPETVIPEQKPPQELQLISTGEPVACESGFIKDGSGQCIDVDECQLDNFGCSHVCININGSASCSCPTGFSLLEDWKTCDDVDECRTGELNCAHECVNIDGSAQCQCRQGFLLLPNGECQVTFCPSTHIPHLGELLCNSSISVEGKYGLHTQCEVRCPDGMEVTGTDRIVCGENGHWDFADYNCSVVQSCPALQKPQNGNVEPDSCWNGVNLNEDSCRFTCDTGYTLVGHSRKVCNADVSSWEPPNIPICEKVQEEPPFVECPSTVTAELPLHRRKVLVHLAKPRSNVPTDQIRVLPAWVRNYAAEFPPGLTLVTYQAVQSATNISATCSVHVNVLDRQPPFVYNCPRPITSIKMPDDQPTTKVSWQEPIFQDNVGIVYVWKSREPGEKLPAGVYHVQYVARDAAGNTGNCGFTIQVTTVPSVWTKA